MIDFRRLKKLYIPCLAGVLLLLTFAAPRASADTISYYLNVPNAAISPYPGPYATVTVNRTDSYNATITFEVYPSWDNSQFMIAAVDTAGFNVNGTASVTLPPTYTQLAGFLPPSPTYGSGNIDGFGSFNFTMQDSDGYKEGVVKVTFTLAATGATSWADAASVLTPNGDGYLAAAHIFVCNSTPCSSTMEEGQALATGFAANGEPIPEPASIALFGSGLIGLAGLLRRRRK